MEFFNENINLIIILRKSIFKLEQITRYFLYNFNDIVDFCTVDTKKDQTVPKST